MGCTTPLCTRAMQGKAAKAMRAALPMAHCGPTGVRRHRLSHVEPRKQRRYIEQHKFGQRKASKLVGVSVGKREGQNATDTGEEESGGMFQMQCPRWLLRSCFAVVTTGQVVVKICKGKIHFRNVLEQIANVGPKSLSVCLLTSCFVGMVFTIQVSPSTQNCILWFHSCLWRVGCCIRCISTCSL